MESPSLRHVRRPSFGPTGLHFLWAGLGAWHLPGPGGCEPGLGPGLGPGRWTRPAVEREPHCALSWLLRARPGPAIVLGATPGPQGRRAAKEEVVSGGRLWGPLASHVFNWPQMQPGTIFCFDSILPPPPPPHYIPNVAHSSR